MIIPLILHSADLIFFLKTMLTEVSISNGLDELVLLFFQVGNHCQIKLYTPNKYVSNKVNSQICNIYFLTLRLIFPPSVFNRYIPLTFESNFLSELGYVSIYYKYIIGSSAYLDEEQVPFGFTYNTLDIPLYTS